MDEEAVGAEHGHALDLVPLVHDLGEAHDLLVPLVKVLALLEAEVTFFSLPPEDDDDDDAGIFLALGCAAALG